MKSIEENNCMIAKFEGAIFKTNLPYTYTKSGWFNSRANASKDIVQWYDFKYHTSWDWLMPVISKIDKLMLDQPIDSPFEVNAEEIFTSLREVNIKLTFNKVCQFIEWYNQNK